MSSQVGNYETNLINLEKFKFDKNSIITNQNSTICILSDEKNEKYIAKSCPKEFNTMEKHFFCREMKILILIQHPTIIKMIGFSYKNVFNEDNFTIITKYMENKSLYDLINLQREPNKQVQCSNTQQQIILTGIAFGMMLLHHHHVINRDLKPENVILDKDLNPCLCDFGLSKIFDPDDVVYQSMKSVGTLIYTAPEVFQSTKFDIKIDVYSFGILMYELVTKTIAYEESPKKSSFQFQQDIINGKRPIVTIAIRDKYPGFVSMFEQCWLKNPADRPSFGEIFRKLSLLPNEFFKPFEEQFPFLKEEDDCILDDDLVYSFEDVIKDDLYSYVGRMLNSLRPEKKIEFDSTLFKTIDIIRTIFEFNRKECKVTSNCPKEKETFLSNLKFFFPKKKRNSIVFKRH